MTNNPKSKPEPFIQWVGGKRKLAYQLISHIPLGLNNYYEPFLGGGALFFQVKDKFKRCFLSDINLDLVTSYNAVKTNPEAVRQLLAKHDENHSREYFYQMRGASNSNNPDSISARFLYLNRYSFKSIFRVNKNGTLDMSFSTRVYRTSKAYERIKDCSKSLQGVSIYANDYSFIEAGKEDFVYLDPPYHKAGENFYTRLPFDESEQIRVKNFADQLDRRGAKFMVSNSDTDFIRDLYKDYKIDTIGVEYAIRDNRKKMHELVIMNY